MRRNWAIFSASASRWARCSAFVFDHAAFRVEHLMDLGIRGLDATAPAVLLAQLKPTPQGQRSHGEHRQTGQRGGTRHTDIDTAGTFAEVGKKYDLQLVSRSALSAYRPLTVYSLTRDSSLRDPCHGPLQPQVGSPPA